jgi:PHD/YefM family antitoxin component YafN of YafNO toxin-antitoxin module
MKLVALEDNLLSLEQLTAIAREQPVVLTRNGKPVVTIRDVSASDWESVSLANNPRFIELIEESRRSHREQGGVRLADARRELGIRRPSPKLSGLVAEQ